MNAENVIKNKAESKSVAKIVIVDPMDRALILTIGEYKEHPEKSFTPDLPGGLVENDETQLDGVLRETEEEAGIILDPKDVTLVYAKTAYYPDKNESVSRFLYTSRIDHTPEVTISWEHESFEWVPIDTLLDTKTFRSFYNEAIQYAVAHDLL